MYFVLCVGFTILCVSVSVCYNRSMQNAYARRFIESLEEAAKRDPIWSRLCVSEYILHWASLCYSQWCFCYCRFEKKTTLKSAFYRAGFRLSRALFRKKCVGPSPGPAPSGVTRSFPGKTDDLLWSSLSLLFIAHFHSSVANYLRHVAMSQKICHSSCGGPFFVGPLFGGTCWTCLNPPLLLLFTSFKGLRLYNA